MTNKEIIIDGKGCRYKTWDKDCALTGDHHGDNMNPCKFINEKNCYYKQLRRKEQECERLKKQLFSFMNGGYCANGCSLKQQLDQLNQTLTEIKEIAEPYKMAIKKICGNCKKYDGCHACCYKDINCYKYTSSKTNACEEFTCLDELVLNVLANKILQKISEVENGNSELPQI